MKAIVHRQGALLIGLLVLLALPLLVPSNYLMRLVNLALVFALLAVSLNVILGYAGQIALGHAGLFGVGAYTTALITAGGPGWLFWPALVASGLVTGLAGLVVGMPTLRLRGHYIALATLGFGEIMRHVFYNWREVTHGMDGIANIPPPVAAGFAFASDARMYFLLLAVLALALLAVHRIAGSKFGRMLGAIRDAELSAGTCGVDVPRLKIIAFFISAVLAGVAGSLYASLMAYISPDVFVFDVTAQVLSMVLIGGVATTWGPVIGAVALTFLPELLRISKAYYQLIYGAGIVLLIVFLPGGLLGLFKRRRPEPVAEAAPPSDTAFEMPQVPAAQPAQAGEPPLLEVRGLTCSFGGLVAIDNLDLQVQRGTVHALIGPNGAGKSTFINLASGIHRANAGSIVLQGQPLAGLKPWQVARLGLVRSYQNLRLFNSMTVLDNVLVGCRAAQPAGWLQVMAGSPGARAEEAALRNKAEQALRFVGLWPLHRRIVKTLPHEQQRLVEIARAWVMDPQLMMLDEPAAGMNPADVERLIERILQLRALGITILLVEHNMHLVMRVADRITVLNFGKKIAEGTPDDIRRDRQVNEAYLGKRGAKAEAGHAFA